MVIPSRSEAAMKAPSEQTHEEWVEEYNGQEPAKVIALPPTSSKTKPPQNGKDENQKPERFLPKHMAPKIVAPDDLSALIPEDYYTAKCYDFDFGEFWGSSKLILKFEISEGRYAGTHLECFFNLDQIKNPDGEYVLAPKKRSTYLRMMRQLFGDIQKAGGDWLSPHNLVGKSFKVEVVTVTKDHAKESLGCNQYSKIKPDIELLQ
jgi:hypothetical protein